MLLYEEYDETTQKLKEKYSENQALSLLVQPVKAGFVCQCDYRWGKGFCRGLGAVWGYKM